MLQRLDDSSPNELFRFVHVRSPVRAPTRLIALMPPSSPQGTARTGSTPSLLSQLESLQGTADQLAASQRLVAKYKTSEAFIGSADCYGGLYPEVTAFAEWLEETRRWRLSMR